MAVGQPSRTPGDHPPGPHPEDLLARVQELSDRVDRLEDPRARELSAQLVSAVIAMYGDGLERIMARLHAAREAGETILDELAQDGAVASLLLIHDLYPVSLRDRVLEALDTVRPYMESHGGDVELLALGDDGVARIALRGSCHGCSASRATLETAIIQALTEHCPDLPGIDVDGVVDDSAVSAITGMALPMADADLPAAAAALPTGGLQLPVMQSTPTPTPTPASSSGPGLVWTELDPARRPAAGTLAGLRLEGRDVLLADVAGTLLAYADECAACGEPLRDGELGDGGGLRCAHCDAEFDLPRAGRAAGSEPLQLRPLPLLEAPVLRVAV